MPKRNPMFGEIKDLFESGDDNTLKYRGYYFARYGKGTTLSDDDIIDVVAATDDDCSPEDWAGKMQEYEQGLMNADAEATK